MVFRRFLVVGLVIAACASAAEGQVRLTIGKDGRPVITNVGSRKAGRGGSRSDLEWLARQRDRVSEYDEIISRHARQYGVDPVLVKAVIQVESNFDPGVVSRKGARGLMQLMPGTARRFGVKKVHDPEQNIRGGVQYLAVLMKMFPGDLRRVLAAYNAGEGAVTRYGGIPPYEETQTYVQRALTVYYGSPTGGGAVYIAAKSGSKVLRGGFKTAARPPLLASAASTAAVVR